jgi:predicted permease
MEWFNILMARLRALFRRESVLRDIEEELRIHIEMETETNIKRGALPDDARAAAMKSFGALSRKTELSYDIRGGGWLETLWQDLRFGIRILLKQPGFSLTAILMLALGIGATTAIFSIVEGVLLRPLPFPGPERLIILGDVLEGAFYNHVRVTAPDIRNYMRDTESFSHLGGYQGTGFELSGAGDPMAVNATRISGEVFAALEVAPLLGRAFTQQEDEEHQQVAVLSYGMWRSRFHGDASILGSKILLDRKPYIVVGVMPRNFEFPLNAGHVNQSELWVPLSLRPEEFTAGYAASWSFRMVGRLKPGVTAAQAQSDAERVARKTMGSYPAFMRSLRIRAVVTPLHEDTVERARPLVRTLFLAVIVVLLIACANLAGLLLVRSIRRRREIAVKLALGARAATLLRQAIVDSMVLSLAGGAIGLALAAIALRVGVSALPETLPRVREIGLDWRVMLFALGLALLTGLLCGLAPAFAAIRTSVNEALKEGGRTGSPGSGHARLRSTLVVAEIAVALILLTASGLLLRSFEKMRDVNLGFQPDHTLAAIYVLPHNQYATQSAVDTFCEDLLRNLRQAPGVEAVGSTSALPATGNYPGIAFTVDGYLLPKDAGLNMAMMSPVRGDPFQALGIRLLRGRVFTDSDKADSQLVAIVNRKMAQRYWPGQDPIGKRLRRGMPETDTPWMTVVGEVDDVKMGSPDEETMPQVYQPAPQTVASEGVFASAGELSATSGWIVLRSRIAPEQMENLLRAAVQNIDPQLPLYQMRTMEQAISDSEAPRRFNTVLISSFAIAAVLLSVLGIYAVIAFSAALREQEIAVRMALGCQRSGVFVLILSSGVKLAAIGCALGLLGSVAASRLLRSFLFDVSPFDPRVLTLAALAMLLLTLAASALPAKRASSTDPMLALRGE